MGVEEKLNVRFKAEIVPYEIVIAPLVKQTDPLLLPQVERDYRHIREDAFADKTPEAGRKLYIATAGAPGAGKSTVLDQETQGGQDPRYANAVFVDPDRGALEHMRTYRGLLTAGDKAGMGIKEAGIQAYDRARPASNVISNLIYNEAVEGGHNVIHGTTNTAPVVGKSLEKLKAAGYETKLLLVSASDDTRLASVQRRNDQEAFYQSTPEDFKQKSVMFAQRHMDYFKGADEVSLYWHDAPGKNAVKAAEYKEGALTVVNPEAFKAYTDKYETDRQKLAKDNIVVPSWAELEAARPAAPSARSAPGAAPSQAKPG